MSDKNAIKKQLQDLYKSVIEDKLGAIANIDKDGNINFKYGALGNLVVALDAETPNYFRLIDQVNVAEWDDKAESVALKVANEVNMRVKCITQSIMKLERNDSVRLVLMNAVEAFIAAEDELPTAEFLRATLEIYAGALDAGRNLFSLEYEKLNGNS